MHGKIVKIEGARLGATMVTLPGGQRWARDGYGISSYHSTEMEAATAFMRTVPDMLRHLRQQVETYESVLEDCERVFREDEERKAVQS